MNTVIKKYKSKHKPWDVYRVLYQRFPVCFFLDSIQYRQPDQNYSYLVWDPVIEVSLPGSRSAACATMRVKDGLPVKVPLSRLFNVLRRRQKKYALKVNSRFPFFQGGWMGFLSYEMAAHFDRIRFRGKPRSGEPLLFLGLFRNVLVYDHRQKVYYAVTGPYPGKGKDAGGMADRQMAMRDLLCEKIIKQQAPFRLHGFHPDISRVRFEKMVSKARSYICAGDIYQANLSQRFSFQSSGSNLTLYDKLRKINPSPFAAFIKVRDLEVISSSPERLVSKRGRICETRPIAGTRPRTKGRKESRRMRRELLTNEKEKAEHVMLVDLERNDLGRVCDWRSVKVDEMMTVEKYSHVIHIVSKITGLLRKNRDAFDLLAAMFPGGTITGCPKLRCMEIIDELEPVARGLYTGSLGYIDYAGNMDFNIIIRTLIMNRGKGHLQVGAGIVHDSDPSREFEETLHKGEALIEALMQASGAEHAGKKRKKVSRL